MPSVNASVDRTDPRLAVRSIVRRYHRVERAASWLLALSIAAVAVLLFLSLPFLIGVIAALGLLVLVRLPLVRRQGETRLETDADPETVRADFKSTAPPVLVFQWGLVDITDMTVNDETVEYEVSYLFGFRTVAMQVETIDRSGSESASSGTNRANELELVVTVDGTEWASYTIRIREREGRTVVNVMWTTDHRVDIRHLLQGLVARRYYPDALAALGYETRMRNGSWSL